jgi:hypothetical protein
MTTLFLLLVLAFLLLGGFLVSLAFSRACTYASLLDELDACALPSRARRASAGHGQASAVHGSFFPQARVPGPRGRLGHGHGPC